MKTNARYPLESSPTPSAERHDALSEFHSEGPISFQATDRSSRAQKTSRNLEDWLNVFPAERSLNDAIFEIAERRVGTPVIRPSVQDELSPEVSVARGPRMRILVLLTAGLALATFGAVLLVGMRKADRTPSEPSLQQLHRVSPAHTFAETSPPSSSLSVRPPVRLTEKKTQLSSAPSRKKEPKTVSDRKPPAASTAQRPTAVGATVTASALVSAPISASSTTPQLIAGLPGRPLQAVTPGVPAAPPALAMATIPAPATAPVPVERPERTAIQDVLNRYRRAFNALDAHEAEQAWPAVDSKALNRAFDRLAEQRFEFQSCDIFPTRASAVAVCRGTARFVPKVGNRSVHIESRTWTFSLRKMNENWRIESVEAR